MKAGGRVVCDGGFVVVGRGADGGEGGREREGERDSAVRGWCTLVAVTALRGLLTSGKRNVGPEV